MYDTGLADRIRAKGVRVVEVAGWKTRGSSTYTPTAAVWHHTAGARTGTAPSLAVCTYGRNDLSGPLCQVLQSREPDSRDIAYVIAAGRANHAGLGSWRGVTGNSNAGGLEVEHTGTTKVATARHEISARILAALLEAGSRDAALCCLHREWAPNRKIDFHDPSPWSGAVMRQRVAHWIGRTEHGEEDLTPEQAKQLDDLVVAVGRIGTRLQRVEGALARNGDTLDSPKDDIGERIHETLVKVRELHDGSAPGGS